MFPARAPENMILLEALVGGRLYPERCEMDDKALIDASYRDLSQLLHLPEPPCFTRVLRSKHPIPQLEKGHLLLQQWRDQTEKDLPGLHVCGFGWEGIGMNDMIKKAKAVAAAVSDGTTRLPQADPPKPVYF